MSCRYFTMKPNVWVDHHPSYTMRTECTVVINLIYFTLVINKLSRQSHLKRRRFWVIVDLHSYIVVAFVNCVILILIVIKHLPTQLSDEERPIDLLSYER